MSPRDLLESYALPLASFVTVVGLFLVWIMARRRERRRARRRSPTGPGVALALALDGDLARAREILVGEVKDGGPEGLDALVGLVAVLKAEGDLGRARSLLDRLAARQSGPSPWLDAMRMRLALDDGRLDDACRLVDDGADLPLEMAIAALGRAGRWADALRRYRQAVPRRQREPRIEAALAAGCAAELQRGGQPRSARRALKRALALDPDGVLPLAVAADLHPREAERHRLARALGERLPGGHGETTEPAAVEHARRRWSDGEYEPALGLLRDHLEHTPRDWVVRRLYARWIVEIGEPADWRAELAELLGLLTAADDDPVPVECSRCGHAESEPFAVCPRCDALGSIRAVARRRDEPRRGMPSSAGAALAELLMSAEGANAAGGGPAG